MIDKYLSVPQVAERLHIDPRAVRREINDGNLEAVRVNRRGDFRVSEASLTHWISRRDRRHSA